VSRKLICGLLILFIVCTQSACGGGNFNDFEAQFMDQYYKIIQNVYSTEVDGILLKLQSEENADILNKMNEILQDNKDMRKKNVKKYDKLKELYTGLVALKEAYKKWDSYDLDKQQYLNMQLSNIYVHLSILEHDKKEKSESK
jgi:hypothetical protein